MDKSENTLRSAFDDLFPGPVDRVALTPVSTLARAARVFPTKTAIIDGSRRISYAEMNRRCRQLADALRKSNIGPGDVVSIMAPNVPAMIEAHFAVPMSGAVLNTINTRLDTNAVLAILRHAEARVLFVDEEFTAVADAVRADASLNVTVIDITEGDHAEGYEAFLASGSPFGDLPEIEDEDAPISLNYTSGTTGNPKGVVYSHRGAALNALGNALSMGLGPNSTYLWTLPLFHCNGWTHCWAMVTVGGTQVCLRKTEPAMIFDLVARHRVTHLAAAPVVLSMLIHAPESDRRRFDHIVRIATGGAAPPSTVIKAMEDLGFAVTHLYGLTETYGPSLICEPQEEWADLPLPDRARLMARQGVPHPLVGDVSVRDSDDITPLPWDGTTVGEIMVRGNTTMKGYLKNPEATAKAFAGSWFRTGDLGVTHPDGYIEIKDRSKDIIITGGENVSSLEVEEVLYLHPDVMEAAVVARPDSKWGETPMAFIALKPNAARPDPEALTIFCKERLAGFKTPKHFEFGDLPKTPTGKVQKNVLRKRAAELVNKDISSRNKPGVSD